MKPVCPPDCHAEFFTALDKLCTPTRFAALLAGLVCLTWADVLLGLGTFVIRDFAVFGYPLANYHRESFWGGELPLWNPLSYCGVPFLAQWNTMVLYPGSLLYLLLPLSWSLPVFCVLHLYWGGVGMYRLAREWTGRDSAAAFAGLAFAFNGLTLNSLMWPNNIAALGWLPWVLWSVERAVVGGGRALAIAALAGALQMLTGAPELILFTWLFAAGWLLAKRAGWLHWGRLMGVAALVGLMSAAQLLPFFDLLQHSQRDANYGGAAWSLPWWRLANLLVPLFRCVQTPSGNFLQPEQIWTLTFYAGVTVLLVAALGVRRSCDQRAMFLLLVSSAALWLGLGPKGGAYSWIGHVIPLGFMRFPVKFVALLTITLPLLAAVGWQRLAGNSTGQRGNGWPFGVLLALVAGIGWWGGVVTSANADVVGTNAIDSAIRSGAHLIFFGGACWAGLRARTVRARQLLGIIALLVVWSDLVFHLPGLMPRVSRAAYEAVPLVKKHIPVPPPQAGTARIMLSQALIKKFYLHTVPDYDDMLLLMQVGMPCNLNLLHNIPKVDGFLSLTTKEQQAIEDLVSSRTETRLGGLMDFMSVSHVIVFTNELQWNQRSTSLPWITAGQAVVAADDATTLKAVASPSFQPHAITYAATPLGKQQDLIERPQAAARVLSHVFGPHRIDCEVESPTPTVVVIGQSFYHPWRATVNGQPTEILRANHAFQAVPVPAGRSAVRLEYVDRRFQLGVVLSALGLIVCGVLWWRARKVPNVQ